MSGGIIRVPLCQSGFQHPAVGWNHDEGVSHAQEGHHTSHEAGRVGQDLGEDGPEGGEEEEGDGQAEVAYDAQEDGVAGGIVDLRRKKNMREDVQEEEQSVY